MVDIKVTSDLRTYQAFILNSPHTDGPIMRTKLSYFPYEEMPQEERLLDKTFACHPDRTNAIQTWKKLSIICEQILIVATSRKNHLDTYAVNSTTMCCNTDQLVYPENVDKIRISFKYNTSFTSNSCDIM